MDSPPQTPVCVRVCLFVAIHGYNDDGSPVVAVAGQLLEGGGVTGGERELYLFSLHADRKVATRTWDG